MQLLKNNKSQLVPNVLGCTENVQRQTYIHINHLRQFFNITNKRRIHDLSEDEKNTIVSFTKTDKKPQLENALKSERKRRSNLDASFVSTS